MPIVFAWIFSLSIAAATWLQLADLPHRRPPVPADAAVSSASEAPSRPQQEQVLITLADGTQMAGKMTTRPGSDRRWLKIEGLSTTLLRPVPDSRVVTIQTLLPKPPVESSPVRTDAQAAHELLFGKP